MRFSEAILLGSTEFTAVAGVLIDGNGACAIGMAWFAQKGDRTLKHWHQSIEEWPWLARTSSKPPCGCMKDEYDCFGFSLFDCIAHMFDCHVADVAHSMSFAQRRGDRWTLEQLVDYVRTIEPAEDAASEQELAERLRLEDISAEREGTEIYTSGYPIL